MRDAQAHFTVRSLLTVHDVRIEASRFGGAVAILGLTGTSLQNALPSRKFLRRGQEPKEGTRNLPCSGLDR